MPAKRKRFLRKSKTNRLSANMRNRSRREPWEVPTWAEQIFSIGTWHMPLTMIWMTSGQFSATFSMTWPQKVTKERSAREKTETEPNFSRLVRARISWTTVWCQFISWEKSLLLFNSNLTLQRKWWLNWQKVLKPSLQEIDQEFSTIKYSRVPLKESSTALMEFSQEL